MTEGGIQLASRGVPSALQALERSKACNREATRKMKTEIAGMTDDETKSLITGLSMIDNLPQGIHLTEEGKKMRSVACLFNILRENGDMPPGKLLITKYPLHHS